MVRLVAIKRIIYTIHIGCCNYNFHKIRIYSYSRPSTATKRGAIRGRSEGKPHEHASKGRLKDRSERSSAPPPGSATHGYRKSRPETTTRRRSRRCSRVRWPRFSHLALRPHPSNAVHEQTFSNPVLRPLLKKSFGETFGATTGVSDPRLQKIQTQNNGTGGEAAAVAGDVGPGFHIWPSGHIPQDTAPKPLLRIRSHAKKTFGEAFGAATGVSDPSYRKSESETTIQAAKPPL